VTAVIICLMHRILVIITAIRQIISLSGDIVGKEICHNI